MAWLWYGELMHVSIDKAGRIVVPKRVRERLGFSAERGLELEIVDGHLELSARQEPAKLVSGPHGLSFAATGAPVDDEEIRRTLEAVRERD